MSEPTLDERECRICKKTKLIDDFQIDSRYKLGRTYLCKACNSGEVRRIYRDNPLKKLLKNSDYRQENWEKIKAKAYEYQGKNVQKRFARTAVNNAVKVGKFAKQACKECGKVETEFHHTDGYDEANWFVGLWLCKQHHTILHNLIREEARNGQLR